MDTGRGMFCRGPSGPYLGLPPMRLKTNVLPLTANLVQEDVLLCFLATRKSKTVDRDVIRGIGLNQWDVDARHVSEPTITSESTNTPIAIANSTWNTGSSDLLGRCWLENGLTRCVYYLFFS